MVARHQSRTKVFSDEALAFDDVLLVPSYSDILPANVNLSSFFNSIHRTENSNTISCNGYSN
jgi:hypothetical protein